MYISIPIKMLRTITVIKPINIIDIMITITTFIEIMITTSAQISIIMTNDYNMNNDIGKHCQIKIHWIKKF